MSAKFLLLFAYLVFHQAFVSAQFNPTVRSSRPGQSLDPYSVGKGVYQVQNGFYLGGSHYEDDMLQYRYFSNQAVLRFGLSERFELNAGWNYRSEQQSINDSLFRQDGTELNALGMRMALQEGKGIAPSLGAQFSLRFPALGRAFRSNYLAPIITLIANGEFSSRLNYTLNLGMVYDGISPKAAGIYTVNIAYQFSSDCFVFLENYGNFSDTHFENRWNAGLGYLISPNLQLDIYGGLGYNDALWDYFCSIGFSWRYVNKKVRPDA